VKVYATRKLSAGISLSAESDKGYAPLTAPPFEKGGRKLSRLGSAVYVCSLSSLFQLLRSHARQNFCPRGDFFRSVLDLRADV